MLVQSHYNWTEKFLLMRKMKIKINRNTNLRRHNFKTTGIIISFLAILVITSLLTFISSVEASVSITSPSAGADVVEGTTLQLTADVVGDPGVVAVKFRIDGGVVYTDTTIPYQYDYTVPVGIAGFIVSAIAVDQGDTTISTSADVSVSVLSDQIPTVSITGPGECGVYVVEGEEVTLTAYATDDTGIASVTFSANGQEIFVDTSFPYEGPTTIPVGLATFDIEAISEDLSGKSSVPDTCSLNIFYTDVIGQVEDEFGSPVEGVVVNSNGHTATTISDGTFLISNVSATSIQVEATVTVGSQLFVVRSGSFGAVRDGTTDVLILALVKADEYDSDGDCLPYSLEKALGLDPYMDDTDGDGTLDGEGDYDRDGISNCEEVLLTSNPLERDSDGDGFVDGYENTRGTDLNDNASTPTVDIYVDPIAADGGDGTNGSPFNKIQDALDAAQNYGLIQLANGTYTGYKNKGLSYGGKPLMVVSENGAENCIIDCEMNGSGFVFNNAEGQLSILKGVTVRNGRGVNGGAIYCSAAGPTIQNCTFERNSATEGGGIYISSISGITLQNCTFTDNNSTRYGGAIYNSSSDSMTMENCEFADNSSEEDGGAIYNNNSNSMTMANCAFTNNSAGAGGTIYNNTSD